jgi:hypothetical protein
MVSRIVYKAARGLKETWNFATGVTLMKKNNVAITEASEILRSVPALMGGVAGLMIGPIAGMETDSVLTALEFTAGLAFLPPVAMHMTYALYKVGEQKEKQLLLADMRGQQIAVKPEQAQLPQPEAPLI